jgi:hypothetical protein
MPDPHATVTRPSVLHGFLILAGVVVAIAAFITLSIVLGLPNYWAGFLFLLVWGGVEHMKIERLPACALGSLVGLGFTYALESLPGLLGPQGLLLFTVAVLVLMYCQIMGWFGTFVNLATMLFLTVGSIPLIHPKVDFRSLLSSLVLGVVYFAGLVLLGHLLKRRSLRKVSIA